MGRCARFIPVRKLPGTNAQKQQQTNKKREKKISRFLERDSEISAAGGVMSVGSQQGGACELCNSALFVISDQPPHWRGLSWQCRSSH